RRISSPDATWILGPWGRRAGSRNAWGRPIKARVGWVNCGPPKRRARERVAMSVRPSPSIKSEEVARFEALGDTWWDPEGPMAPLHRVNPIRIGWARALF